MGLVGNIRHGGPTSQPNPTIYIPHAQSGGHLMFIAVRSTENPQKLIPVIRGIVRSMDGNLPIIKARTMQQRMMESLAGQNLAATLLAAFGGFALLLAAIGIYGVVPFSVTQRTIEMRVRFAWGQPRAMCLDLFWAKGPGWQLEGY